MANKAAVHWVHFDDGARCRQEKFGSFSFDSSHNCSIKIWHTKLFPHLIIDFPCETSRTIECNRHQMNQSNRTPIINLKGHPLLRCVCCKVLQ